jgi:hypothetical protein
MNNFDFNFKSLEDLGNAVNAAREAAYNMVGVSTVDKEEATTYLTNRGDLLLSLIGDETDKEAVDASYDKAWDAFSEFLLSEFEGGEELCQ